MLNRPCILGFKTFFFYMFYSFYCIVDFVLGFICNQKRVWLVVFFLFLYACTYMCYPVFTIGWLPRMSCELFWYSVKISLLNVGRTRICKLYGSGASLRYFSVISVIIGLLRFLNSLVNFDKFFWKNCLCYVCHIH